MELLELTKHPLELSPTNLKGNPAYSGINRHEPVCTALIFIYLWSLQAHLLYCL